MTDKTRKASALVIFGPDLPRKNERWWRQFEVVVAPQKYAETITQKSLTFIELESFIDSGNVLLAEQLVEELSRLTHRKGSRISKAVNFRGFELWWIHYDDLLYRFCLPYTEYHRMLVFLQNFPKIFFYQPPFDTLFKYYLEARGRECVTLKGKSQKRPSLGMIFQALISFPFLLGLAVVRPKLMVWTSDLFEQSNDFDFRYKFVYEEMRRKKIAFVEFIRSLEPVSVVLAHAWERRRPVIYSYAVINVVKYMAFLSGRANDYGLSDLVPAEEADAEQKFKFSLATHYLSNVRGEVWSILLMKFFLKIIGVKAAIVPVALSRNFCEVLACKLAGIPTVGILHGAPSKGYNVYEFMPAFDGDKYLSVDKYGLWSQWWKEYFIKNSRAYQPEQLFVSGPMRPWQKDDGPPADTKPTEGGLLKVLFVAEHLAAPLETLPFLRALAEEPGLSLRIKFRASRDNFEEWLKNNHPEILSKIGRGNLLKGNMAKAIADSDVVVGSHSTGVLESLLQLKPFVFFKTDKWGDCFDLESFDSEYGIFAKNPEEFLAYVKKSGSIPQDVLISFRDRFFGNPYANGGKWVIEQVEGYL